MPVVHKGSGPGGGQFQAGPHAAPQKKDVLAGSHHGVSGEHAAYAEKNVAALAAALNDEPKMSSGQFVDFLAAHPESEEARVVNSWGGIGYSEMNRNPNSGDAKAFRQTLAKVEPYKSDKPLHRGLSFDSPGERESFIAGLDSQKLNLNGRTGMSTTKSQKTAVTFATALKHGVLLEIRNHKSGRDLQPLEKAFRQWGGEEEVVFTQGAQFAKVGVTKEKSGLTKIILTEL